MRLLVKSYFGASSSATGLGMPIVAIKEVGAALSSNYYFFNTFFSAIFFLNTTFNSGYFSRHSSLT